MKQNKEDQHLFEYYQDKIHPVLLSIKDTVHIHSVEDIHKLRVNLKKIKSLFYLFEIAAPRKFKADKSYAVFEEIFKQAGKIREAQLNVIFIVQHKLPAASVALYKKYLDRKENKAKKQFSGCIADLKNKKVQEVDEEIEKLCRSISTEKILKHSQIFISRKIKEIQKGVEDPNIKSLHKIRKNLKSINAVSSLLYTIVSSGEISDSQVGLKETENMLGDWHDMLVFEQSLEQFLKSMQTEGQPHFVPLSKLLHKIKANNQVAIKEVTQKIKTAITQF